MIKLIQPKFILAALGIFLTTYILSFLGYLFPAVGQFLFWIIILICFYLIRKDLSYGVLMLIAELFIGAKGYLFSTNILDFIVSIRLALFVIIFLAWLIEKIKHRDIKFISTKFFLPFSIFTIWLLVGIITALINGNYIKNIFFDLNGYLYFALAFVVFDTLINEKRIKQLFNTLVAGGLAISILTIYIFLNFTILHQDSRPDMADAISTEQTIDEEEEDEEGRKISHSITAKYELRSFDVIRNTVNQKPMIYRWSQDTGTGEISYLAGPFFRAFSSGQLYSLVLLIMILTFFFKREKWGFNQTTWLLLIFGVLSGLALLICFSRSLWLGLIAGVIFLLFNLSKKRAWKIIIIGIVLICVTSAVIYFITPDVFEVIGGRLSSIINPSEESSGTNRINILTPAWNKILNHPLIGSGFGSTIIYESVTPEKLGTLRVFAFEWSYIDTIIEIGLIGVMLYFWLIIRIFREGYSLIKKESLKNNKVIIIPILALMSALFSMLVANITTPYLNHPLGIGLIITIMAFIYFYKEKDIKKY